MNKKKSNLAKLKKYLPLYIMLLPGAAYLIINNYIPMSGIIIAFKKFNYQKGIFGSDFNGLKNFEFLFGSKEAWNITKNTILYNMVFIALGTLIAVAVAVLLNEIRNKTAKVFYQTVVLLPFLISIVVVSYVVYGFLSTQSGFINNTILNGKGISWYSSPKYWPIIIVIVQIWKNFGYNCVIYYATIVGIDNTYYEAAVIDGASHWQQIRYITLPVIKPTMTILILMSVSKIFYSDFGLFYQIPMNSGPLIDVTNTIDTYVYRGLVELNNVGMAAAAGLYQSLVGFVLVLTANRIVKKYSEESALF